MTENTIWIQVGVGGLFALMVIREVFNFLKSRKNGRNGSSRTTDSQTNFYTTTLSAIALNAKSAADSLVRLEQQLVRKFDNVHKHIDDSQDRVMEKIENIPPDAGD